METTNSRIDPRVTRTRKLLVEAFISLMAEKNFDEIVVQDITERATVNRSTFYAHFVDKYALVDDLIRTGFTRVLQQRMSMPAHTVEEHLRRLILAVCVYLTELQSLCKHSYQKFDAVVEAQVKAQLREQVRSTMLARSEPRAHSHPRIELLATIVSWAIYGAALEWSQRPGTQSAEAFVEEALPLIAASIAAFEGRTR